MSSVSDDPLPSFARQTILSIKEITGNYEEEIYEMLRECSMDPNETIQKLLLQDTFHEVKRKRDKKKESPAIREPGESRLRHGMQRYNRRGHSPHFSFHDAGGSKNYIFGGKNGINQVSDKGIALPFSPTSQGTKHKETPSVPSSMTEMVSGSTDRISEETDKFRVVPPTSNATSAFRSGEMPNHPSDGSNNSLSSNNLASSSPVPAPSHESTLEILGGSHQSLVETISIAPAESTVTALDAVATSRMGSSLKQVQTPARPHGVGNNQIIESLQSSPSSTSGVSTVRRPLSGQNSQMQHVMGPQKVPSKEWKPKSMNPHPKHDSGAAGTADVLIMPFDADSCSHTVSSAVDSEETSKVQRKLEGLHLPGWQYSNQQHVIIPNHIHVPESERMMFSFGSIDDCSRASANLTNGLDSDWTPVLSSDTQGFEHNSEGHSSRHLDDSRDRNSLEYAKEEDHTACSESLVHVAENLLSVEGNVPSSAVLENNSSKQETALLHEGDQYSAAHHSSSHSFGFGAPILGGQIDPFQNSVSEASDATHLPNFVLQGGNSMASILGQSHPVSRVTGVMPSSIAATQQPVPLYRQPTGLHISHFTPNYIPYGHYISPFYAPPPAIHQFLTNCPFPLQPQASPATATTGVKYSIPQYKPGTKTMHSIYGSYGPASSGPLVSNDAYATVQQREGSAVWVGGDGHETLSAFYNLPQQGQHVRPLVQQSQRDGCNVYQRPRNWSNSY